MNSKEFLLNYKRPEKHYFHLVTRSPWPLFASFASLTLTTGLVVWFHYFVDFGVFWALFGLVTLLGIMFVWWRDVIRESTYEGFHTFEVQRGLSIGVVLFIVSEVMFFFSFFWAFFHSSLAPTVELGSVWPPEGIFIFNPLEVPFLNTLILLLSALTVTWVHFFIIKGNYFYALVNFFFTLFLAFLFTALQVFEYKEAAFNISDGVYGSTFFLATGFHGFHVIIGSIFLAVCSVRLYYQEFSRRHHFGFEAAAWYWHFVDVVWLFLYLWVYFWTWL